MNNQMEGPKSINSTNSGDKSPNLSDELKELQHSLTQQQQKNKERYETLKKQGMSVNFQLYSPIAFPIDSIRPSNYEHTKIQLMSSADRLFKEAESLAKIEMKFLNEKHELQQLQDDLKDKIENSYLCLRRALNGEEVEGSSTEDRLDRLNKIIGTLKGGAQQILKQTEMSNKVSMMKHQEILSHPLYEKLKESVQTLRMKSEDERQKLQEQLQSEFQEKEQIRKQNNALRKEVQGYKVKVRSLEMEVAEHLNKVNTLTEKLFQSTHKKAREEKGTKYFGRDFEIDIKTNKEFNLNIENQLVKRTIEELQEFLEGYFYAPAEKNIELFETKGIENVDNNDKSTACFEKEQKEPLRRSLGNKRMNRNMGATRNLIGAGDPQNITKMRFTRTSTLVNPTPGLEAEIARQGYIRKRTDSYRQ